MPETKNTETRKSDDEKKRGEKRLLLFTIGMILLGAAIGFSLAYVGG